jgi:hypothetical protein
MVREHYKQRWVDILGVSAVTVGQHIFYWNTEDRVRPWLRDHELVHTRQYKKYGLIGFLVIYFYWYLVGRLEGLSHWEAYEKIPFEVEAREAERRT